MDSRFERTASLIGEEGMRRLAVSRVVVFGLGGVGGHAAEALARCGVGRIALVDYDTVSLSNINRQVIADGETVGRLKTEVMRERIARIAPDCMTEVFSVFADDGNITDIITRDTSYVIDAVDTVKSKVAVISCASELGVPVISSMGTGNKLYPERFRITDISKTHTCPLARAVRSALKKSGVSSLDVLWSDEPPRTPPTAPGERPVPSSVSFVPSVAGLMIAGYVIRKLAGID